MNDAAILATQAEFARLIGVHRSHVTRLKDDGRLVMVETDKGMRVDVEASKQRIMETEGGRDDEKARHAAAKGQQQPHVPNKRVDAQTRKENALADLAEMDRDKQRGLLIEREEVIEALDGVVAFARQNFENFPHRVAPQLVGKDYEQILAILKQEVVAQMGEMHKQASREKTELTREGTT